MKDQDEAVKVLVEKINTIADGLREINLSIYSYEMLGEPALDLRDKRNVMLDELSSLVDIEYTGNAVGDTFTVTIGGEELVNHTTVTKLVAEPTKTNVITGEPNYEVNWDANGDGVGDYAITLTGGELKAHIDLRDGMDADNKGIAYYMDKLNTFTRAFVQEVNEQHRAGWTHPSNTTDFGGPTAGTSVTGVDFWDVPIGSGGTPDISLVTAGNLKLSDIIKDDIYMIAAADKRVITDSTIYDPATNTFPGNNENMRLLYKHISDDAIKYTDPFTSTTIDIGTLPGYLAGTMLDFSVTLDHSKTLADIHDIQTHNVDNLRLSISSVSLDDEMVNMIKYQHAYEGSSRIITAMDEALDILINKMGLVGRS
jgi:flagellar hook-associated protein 1 FlgK